jgi:hypothetical protein
VKFVSKEIQKHCTCTVRCEVRVQGNSTSVRVALFRFCSLLRFFFSKFFFSKCFFSESGKAWGKRKRGLYLIAVSYHLANVCVCVCIICLSGTWRAERGREREREKNEPEAQRWKIWGGLQTSGLVRDGSRVLTIPMLAYAMLASSCPDNSSLYLFLFLSLSLSLSTGILQMETVAQRAASAAVPNDHRQLRACQRCHLVLPQKQFDRCLARVSAAHVLHLPPSRIQALVTGSISLPQ